MGIYLNPGAMSFRQARRSQVYVDKSSLIAYLNGIVNTERRFVCVSRPRRFGKTMAANMVSAYYDRTVDGAEEFAGLAVADDPGFDAERNRYDVLKLNMQDFLSANETVGGVIDDLQECAMVDLHAAYPGIAEPKRNPLIRMMDAIFATTGRQFVVVIDEWDCIMRENRSNVDGQRLYLDFLRAWLKDKPSVALCYMTGILPIKKYGTHSALNMFDEYSMTSPLEMAPYMGFTEEEVDALCMIWNRDLEECRAWYDGYRLAGVGSSYAPRSVVRAMETGVFGSYWTQTETFEALKLYIDMDMDGLHAKGVELLGGGRVPVNPRTYANDMTTFHNADDVLTLLVHLGYLGYEPGDDDPLTGSVFVPNCEAMAEWANATADEGWREVARSIRESDALLDSLLAGRSDDVAKGVQRAHADSASIIAYNDENALACTLRLAFFSAIRRYKLVREAPTGKGYADLVMVPLKSSGDIPGVVVGLKWGATPGAAIAQIRERGYADAFRGTSAEGNVVLCGIAYDPKSKEHSCTIERG